MLRLTAVRQTGLFLLFWAAILGGGLGAMFERTLAGIVGAMTCLTGVIVLSKLF